MSNPPKKRPGVDPLGAEMMSTERPLDALIAGLRPRSSAPRMPIHPRVLEVDTPEGFVHVFACFANPGSARELHRQLLALIEATVLSELASSPTQVREGLRRYVAMRLFVFPELPWEVGPAVEAFAFAPREWDPERFGETLDVLRGEARDAGHALPAGTPQVWEAPIAHLEGALATKLDEIHGRLAEALGDRVWGDEPGLVSRAFATLALEHLDARIRPNLDGIRALEELIVSRREGALRWMDPLFFQALCDLLGVVAQLELGAKIAWSLCEVGKDGLADPPVFRVTRGNGTRYHIPIAHHVLRWSMMPLHPGERVPSLAEWLVDQIRSEGQPN